MSEGDEHVQHRNDLGASIQGGDMRPDSLEKLVEYTLRSMCQLVACSHRRTERAYSEDSKKTSSRLCLIL